MFKPKDQMLKEILSSMGKKPKDESSYQPKDEREEEGDEDMGKEAAAEDVLSAIQSRDSKALAEALEAFFQMC